MYSAKKEDKTLRIVSALILLAAFIAVGRLFSLQIVSGGFYSALAMDTHEIYRRLFPSRGAVYFKDARDSAGRLRHPAAVNRPYYLIYASPRDIPKDQTASTSAFLSETLGLTKPEEKEALLAKLSKSGDVYAQIAKKVDEKTVLKIKEAKLTGVGYTAQDYRYYPELNTAAHVLGFLGFGQDGDMAGKYGVEGAWNDVLTGKSGFLAAERGALGGWISMAGRTLKQAEDGADFTLTIDRAVQYESCERLRKGFDEFEARSASLVVMDPKTGAVLAMCSLPDFDPNNYSEAKDISYYNNTAIFTPYEPGSVFKPITMAIALDLGLVSPDTTFNDPGERIINDFKIHNALNKKYGTVTMTEVLENSINTGMIWVEEKIGPVRFKDYVEKFGFGEKTGIALDTESSGDISSFSKKAPIYNANASFGQGFTVTPLQLAVAYSALANGGRVLKPRVIDEIQYPNGRVEKFEPETTGAVISPQTQKLINGMLISVVDNGASYKRVKLDNYYVAGKTGTAQIAMGGKYSEESNHTFVGYFPATNPRFVAVVKYEAPQRQWAESTAAPVFKEIAKFLIDYYGIPPER